MKKREAQSDQVRVLVLTFNRTLKGYISSLLEDGNYAKDGTFITCDTFGRWSKQYHKSLQMLDAHESDEVIRRLATNVSLSPDFIIDEVNYTLGRFPIEHIDQYRSCVRSGRGRSPRVDLAQREKLINSVIIPYNNYKVNRKLFDWNDLAALMLQRGPVGIYDIIVVDESQDFSTIQLKAIIRSLSAKHNITFVIDSAQMIYPRGFTWAEVGLTSPVYHRLETNYRNTRQVAALAKSILDGVDIGTDGSFPNFDTCSRVGDLPNILIGKFSQQAGWVIDFLDTIDLESQSVAFFHLQGGRWFDYIRGSLNNAGYHFVELTKASEWPESETNIALCTFHSAKGLEFDHVIILGLSEENMNYENAPDDDRQNMYKRLIGMGVSRARVSVVLGYAPHSKPKFLEHIDESIAKRIHL